MHSRISSNDFWWGGEWNDCTIEHDDIPAPMNFAANVTEPLVMVGEPEVDFSNPANQI